MTNQYSATSTTAQDAMSLLSSIARQVALSRATRLAGLGRYSEAEDLIAGLASGNNQVVPALDLMARIRAQQGRYDEAEALWVEAARLDPEEESFRTGLARLVKLRKRPVRGHLLFLPFSSLLVIIALVVVGFLAMGVIRDLRSIRDMLDSSSAAASSAEQPGVLEPGSEEAGPGGTTGEEIRNLGRAQVLAEIAEQSRRQGVTFEQMDGSILVIFDDGVFGGSTTFAPEAAAVLTALGRRLEPFASQISIEVTGHTDDLHVRAGAAYRDNLALGLERAVSAVDYLRANTDLPARVFLARTAGESQPPHSNDTPAGRLRNRTVTLRISVL